MERASVRKRSKRRRVVGEFRGKPLEGHPAPQPRVLGEAQRPHAAFADLVHDLVLIARCAGAASRPAVPHRHPLGLPHRRSRAF